MNESQVKRTLSYIKMLNNVSLASLKEADTTGEDYATTFKRNLEVEKKKRAPGGGRKRTGGLQPTGALAKLPPIWVDAETLEYLRSLDNLSAFVRLAINEKRERG